jgi:hypothetical protein
MVALNDSAAAARDDARRLRGRAEELRQMVRGNVARSHERLDRAQAQARTAEARRFQPLPSPWSDLRWVQGYETLEQTLVPLP